MQSLKNPVLALLTLGLVFFSFSAQSQDIAAEMTCSNNYGATVKVTRFYSGKCSLSFNSVVANALNEQGTSIYQTDMVTRPEENSFCSLQSNYFYFSAGAPKGYSAVLQPHESGGMILLFTKYATSHITSNYYFHYGECRR